MGIITRSKSNVLPPIDTSSLALSRIKRDNTKNRSRAKSRSTAYRSISPSPINLPKIQSESRRSKTALRTRSTSSSSSVSSSLHSTSRSSSSSSTNSTDSISSDLNNLNLSDISTSPTSLLSSSSEVYHVPEPNTITVIKSTRMADQLCMGGYIYQIKTIGKQGIRWTCKERRNERNPCRTAINTSKNSGTEQNPIYSNSSSTKKRREIETDDEHVKRNSKRKK